MASYLPEFHAPHRHSHHHARQNKPAPIGIPTDTKEANASAPKTPADDAIDFFESAVQHGEPAIQVYELKLEEDGGPNKSRVVSVRPLARGVSRERDLGNSCLAASPVHPTTPSVQALHPQGVPRGWYPTMQERRL